ncbi:MAG: AI-2E family transporter [Betaproteobacteria bacterium]|nr:AI-2E family transporter [Betaproteobacteria bacterium]
MQSFRSDRVLGLAALGLLIVGCFLVLRPFVSAVLWAAILATTLWPVFHWLDGYMGRYRSLTALVTTLLTALVMLAPFVIVALGLAGNVAELTDAARKLLEGGLPEAPQWLTDIPFVGERLLGYWQPYVHDGARLVAAMKDYIEPAKTALLAGGQAIGLGVVQLALSIFLVFFLFRDGEAVSARLQAVMGRLAGERAQRLLAIAEGTVGGVVYGILGTALAQGVLAGIGFAIAGVPGALLLGLATFFLSAVPVGPPLVWIPAALWLFQRGDTGWAIFIAAWGFFVVSTVDNVLKPLIISRGASLPFALVFLGVLGGVLAFGFIGVFLGPTLLAVGYRLLQEWTAELAEDVTGQE